MSARLAARLSRVRAHGRPSPAESAAGGPSTSVRRDLEPASAEPVPVATASAEPVPAARAEAGPMADGSSATERQLDGKAWVRAQRLRRLRASIQTVLARHGPRDSGAPRPELDLRHGDGAGTAWAGGGPRARRPPGTLRSQSAGPSDGATGIFASEGDAGWWQPAELYREPAALPGVRQTGVEGSVRCVRTELAPAHRHGRFRVDAALGASSAALSALAVDPKLAAVDPGRLLFLDTETTGLGRGAATVPFLIGLAWFEDRTLVVEQLLLEELGEEAPMLDRLHQRIEQASALVTFNGKAYDWPLLTQRYVLQRVPPPPPRPHLDLLHCARRVYGRRLNQTRLAELEDEVLGFRRERDVDGAEIPSLYWSFLRHRHPVPMLGVLEHNLHDVVSMAVLLHHLADRYERLDPSEAPEDQLERARVAVRSNDVARAEAFARAAVDGGASPEVVCVASRLLGTLAKRSARFEDAAGWFDRALACAGSAPEAAELHLELAKLHEHRLGDLEAARLHARAAEGAEPSLDWVRRLDRLATKVARAPKPLRPPTKGSDPAGSGWALDPAG